MRALLLAAGKGSRLGNLSHIAPKCLHRVGSEALLDRIVGQLTAVGVTEFLINTHHLADQIANHVTSAHWGTRATLVHEEQLLGTLGTFKANVDFFGGNSGWVLHADNFISGTLLPALLAFKSRPAEAWGSLLTFRIDDPRNFGVVKVDSRGIVERFTEKVPDADSRVASAATYLFDNRVMDFAKILPDICTDISSDLIPRLQGRLVAAPVQGTVIDIGTPEGLAAARSMAAASESNF